MARPLHTARALAACAAWFLTGCAALDPHAVLTRRLPSAADTRAAPISASDKLDAATRQAAFDHVWRTVDERYYDPKMNGVDWKAAGAKWRPLVLEAPDDDTFWDRLDRMAGELRDVHTRVVSPKHARLGERSQAVNLGFAFRPLGETLVVTSVNAESDAWWAGVRPGMTLAAVDGEPAQAVFARLRAEARDGSTQQQRNALAATRLLAGEPDSTARLAFQRADGTLLQATLRRALFTSPPRVAHRRLPDGPGYIRLTAWNASLQGRMLEAITALKDAPSLIIDLRGNGGGSGAMVRSVAQQFFEGEVPAGRVLTRTGKPITMAFELVELVKLESVLKGTGLYKGPVAILVDAGSASASESFAGLMQAHRRATVVGQLSCGCLLGFMGYATVPGGGKLAYSELGFVLPDGRRIEGEGVAPDVPVPPTLEDLRLNRDRVLETAVAQLLQPRAANPAMTPPTP
ncbi:MAG: Tricorn protease [Pseudomonadota bacterium]|jgi:carboxyl-terminal processing protease